ncbi:MAG: hypothetical protein ABI726_05680 [bacterium]
MSGYRILANVAVSDIDTAREFYEGVVGVAALGAYDGGLAPDAAATFPGNDGKIAFEGQLRPASREPVRAGCGRGCFEQATSRV